MSRIKRSLPEDFSVLTGQELDGDPIVISEEEVCTGWHLFMFEQEVDALIAHRQQLTPRELVTIEAQIKRLQKLAALIRKPF